MNASGGTVPKPAPRGYRDAVTMDRFIALWTHPGYPPDKVTESELLAAEARLGAAFPGDYRDAVLRFGLPRPTIDLLDTIVDRRLDHRDVANFLSPEEVVAATRDWREMGLPEHLVAFASDCMGNLFCFPAHPDPMPGGGRPILFFDHDSGAVDTDAESFDRWIDGFCGLAPP